MRVARLGFLYEVKLENTHQQSRYLHMAGVALLTVPQNLTSAEQHFRGGGIPLSNMQKAAKSCKKLQKAAVTCGNVRNGLL
jgi:hypothetical protein